MFNFLITVVGSDSALVSIPRNLFNAAQIQEIEQAIDCVLDENGFFGATKLRLTDDGLDADQRDLPVLHPVRDIAEDGQ
jgi:hypothetical protein